MLAEFTNIAIFGAAKEKSKIWFCNQFNNALLYWDTQSDEIRLECFLPGTITTREYGAMAFCKGRLVIAPLIADRILVYDIYKKVMKAVPLDMDRYSPLKRYNLFFDIKSFDNKVFILPGRFKAIVKLDVETLDIEYLDDWYFEVESKITYKDKIVFSFCNEEKSSCLYLPFWQGNMILVLNMKTEEIRIMMLKTNMFPASALSFDDNKNMYVSFRDKSDVFLLTEDGQIIKRFHIDLGIGKTRGFQFIKAIGDDLILFPFFTCPMSRWSSKSNHSSVIHEIGEKIMQGYLLGKEMYSFEKMMDENIIFAYSNIDGCFILYDIVNCKLYKRQAVISNRDDILEIMKYTMNYPHWGKPSIRRESMEIQLRDFINAR